MRVKCKYLTVKNSQKSFRSARPHPNNNYFYNGSSILDSEAERAPFFFHVSFSASLRSNKNSYRNDG